MPRTETIRLEGEKHVADKQAVDKLDDAVAKTSGGDDRLVPAGTAAGHGDDVAKLVALANIALVGVPAAYAVSHSVAATIIAATAAVVFVIAYVVFGRW
jgi:hypothetical protein